MSLESSELYELFLALAPARIDAARAALDGPAQDRARELEAALVPFAVDATLLGAAGPAELARAVAAAESADPARLRGSLDALERAARSLGEADASGARVDETALRELARALTREQPEPAPAPSPPRAAPPSPAPGSAPATARPPAGPSALEAEDPGELDWAPELEEDMLAAFLDECVERLDGLGERLLVLEERGTDRELIGEIFRDLHTLKGSSAFAGLKKMNRVAHRAEDLIGELRDGKRACDRGLIDLLLETLDVLRQILERARARAPIDVDARDLLRRLADPSRARATPPSASAALPASPDPAGAAASPTPAAPDRQARAPAATSAAQATLRIEFEKVDLLLNLVGEVVLARGRLTAAAESQGALLREMSHLRKRFAAAALAGSQAPLVEELQRTERVLGETFGDLDAGVSALGLAVGQLRDNVMKLRMVPIARLFTKYQRAVRELSHKLGKEVHVVLEGAETELDKVLVERLEDPLLHLVRNSVDHGIEPPDARVAAGKSRSGTVRLAASQRGGQIIVTISDDGGGMDPARLRAKAVQQGLLTEAEAAASSDRESLELIFRAGFSTAARVSDVSGRGVGMDVVRDAITKLKGSIDLDSTLGAGTTMVLRLPLTLAITQVLAVRVGGELVAIPLDAVVSAQSVGEGEPERVADGECLRVGGRLVPIIDLAAVLGLEEAEELGDAHDASVVIVEVGSVELGLRAQQVLGRHEVVIKSLGPLLTGAPCAAGATLIGDRVLLVIDLVEVARRAREPGAAPPRPRLRAAPSAPRRARILVAEDSELIREAIRRELEAAGFEVVAAEDGAAALEAARERLFDAVSTDVMMPRMDGYELTRALRADPRYRDVPIVMVTSKDARLDSMRGYDAGADEYLNKPASASELVRIIDSLLARRRRS
ncbi:MAG: response regulator [Sorangiineae bacterium]|nr:response regulator [Polyangiaceae bacterium]MEB2321997.1 response regulator [Sorangiineae bacterium]